MNLSDLLRQMRIARSLSQLDLAARLGVSQRHVSYLESGRARPSRDLLVGWMQQVEAPRSIRNAALLQAGFAPLQVEAEAAGERQSPARVSLSRMMRAHEPFPGLVFDADWIMLELNAAGRWLADVLMPQLWSLWRVPDRGLDMIASLAHPQGLLARMRAPVEAGAALLLQLRAEQWVRPGLRLRVDALERSLVERYGPLPQLPREAGNPYLHLVFDTEHGALSFYTLQSVFGLPQDVTVASPRFELWFPADAATRDVMVRASREREADPDRPVPARPRT